MGTKKTSAQKLGVELHGVRLNLSSNEPELLKYARSHLGPLVQSKPSGSPHLEVECLWQQGEWDPEANPFVENGPMNVIGKRMLGDQHELIWLNTIRKKGLQLKFRREKDHFHFQVAFTFNPKKKKGEAAKDYRFKKYFSLMSYLVYYPIAWYLESVQGWAVVHASGLHGKQGAVLIAGLGGVGKTTTCVALMQRAGMDLISENLVFTDGMSIYACPEPIRLDEQSLQILGKKKSSLRPIPFPEGLKKKWLFHPRKALLGEALRPGLILFPYFSARTEVRPLSPELAAEKMLAANRLTREIDDFDWYKSALRLHWPQPLISALLIEVIQTLVRQAPCYEIGIDRKQGVQPVVDAILKLYQSNVPA